MQDAQEKLRYLLKAYTARYRRARTAEAVAVVMTAGAVAAAAAQAGWAIAQVRPGAAACLAAVGAIIGITLPLGPIRKILAISRRQAFLCAGVMCAVSLAAVACCLLGFTDAISRPALLSASLCLAGLTAMLVSYIYPPSQQQAAIDIDERCRLGERLSTAAELLENCQLSIVNCQLNDRRLRIARQEEEETHGRDARDTHGRDAHATNSNNAEIPDNFDACAQTIFEQALRAAGEKGVLRAPLWRRTRATAGALGLAILLGATLLLVPTFTSPGAAGSVG
ncbi:MAG: hypothetical protein EHM48_09785, partial [Planctomycetaceae bacterium]